MEQFLTVKLYLYEKELFNKDVLTSNCVKTKSKHIVNWIGLIRTIWQNWIDYLCKNEFSVK